MTMTCPPIGLKAAQQVRPKAGVNFTPPAVTFRSLRGMLTLNTPSFSSVCPCWPVRCSIFPVSSGPADVAMANKIQNVDEATDAVLHMIRSLAVCNHGYRPIEEGQRQFFAVSFAERTEPKGRCSGHALSFECAIR